MKQILITDCDHPSVDIERTVFSRAGYGVRLANHRTSQDVIQDGDGAVGLLSQYAPITAEVIAALPGVRVIGRYGVGLDNIDVPAAESRGISVVSVPDYCTDEVADHAFGLILALTRGFVELDRAIRRGIWDFRGSREVRRAAGMRLGIIGMGRIGSAVARRATVSRFEVVACDPNPTEVIDGVTFMELGDLLDSSDVLTVHVPLNSRTRHLLDASAFELVKPGALLVNTARGGLIDQGAMTDALIAGRLGGAALDVLETEPIQIRDRLLAVPNVILTPHAAFYSLESIVEMKTRVAEGMVSALDGSNKNAR